MVCERLPFSIRQSAGSKIKMASATGDLTRTWMGLHRSLNLVFEVTSPISPTTLSLGWLGTLNPTQSPNCKYPQMKRTKARVGSSDIIHFF